MPKIFKDKNDNVLYTGYETSEVVANPTLVGTEDTLAGFQVGDTKYKVPEQKQADWNQSNDQSPDFIKNKPSIPAAVSGTSSGGYWSTITIGNTTKNIPTMPTVPDFYSIKLRAWLASGLNGECVELYANYIPFSGYSIYSDAFDCLCAAISEAKDELDVGDGAHSGLLLIAYFGNGDVTDGPSLYMGSDCGWSTGVLDDGHLELVKITGTNGPTLLSISSDSEVTAGYKYDSEDGWSFVHKKEW